MSDIQDKLQELFPIHYRSGNILLLNADCMEVMKHVRDGGFSLAIVDPPYGIRENGDKAAGRNRFASNEYKAFAGEDKEPPPVEYFIELQRVSKNQIVWGANHFIDRIAKPSSCWIVWDKVTGNSDFADSELAWTNFQTAVRNFRFQWSGMWQGDMKNKEHRIHPTQKPIALYSWLLTKYAKQGDSILDTHGGSMSIAIACHNLGYELTLCELDEDYYRAGVARFEQHKAQGSLFAPEAVSKAYKQTELLGD